MILLNSEHSSSDLFQQLRSLHILAPLLRRKPFKGSKRNSRPPFVVYVYEQLSSSEKGGGGFNASSQHTIAHSLREAMA